MCPVLQNWGRRAARPVLVLALAFAPWVAASSPPEAITYVERQLRDDAPAGGRTLRTNGGALHGIDINSSVEIQVDATRLSEEITSTLVESETTPEAAALRDHIETLTAAVNDIDPVVESLANVFELWGDAQVSGDFAAFQTELGAVQRRIGGLLNTVRAAIEQQRLAAGRDPQTARREANTALDPVLGPGGTLGYDWDALRDLYGEAIERVEEQLEELADDGPLEIEIRAHLVKAGETLGVPIFLPGYNQVSTGPDAIYNKIRYDISPEALEARDAYLELAKSIEETRSLGQALQASIEAQYRQHAQEIRSLLRNIEAAAEEVDSTLAQLGDWRSAEARQRWFDQLSGILDGPAGQEVVVAWARAQQAVNELIADVEALQAYAGLSRSLAAATTPEDALRTIQSTLLAVGITGTSGQLPPALRVLDRDVWALRREALTRLADSVQALAPDARAAVLASDGPLQDYAALRNAAIGLHEALVDFPDEARRALFGSLAFPGSSFAASLPEPAGQTRLRLAPNAAVDTSFNLRTVAAAREPGDEILVSYRFFRGEEALPLDWTDRFLIRVYGWQDHVAASVALARQESTETWEPTASLSWLLRKRRWPEAMEPGLRGLGAPEWYSGFGLSTMPLQFEDDQDIEIGVALTGSFLNDRIIVGYGVNLQASEDDTFWFISLRLFQNEGILRR